MAETTTGNFGSTNSASDLLDAPRIVRLSQHERVAHFLSVLPITSDPADGAPANAARTVVAFRVFNEASGWLAFTHLNNPALHILPGLRQRLEKCDFRFTLDMRDDEFSPMHAAREVYNIFSGASSTDNAERLLPIGMVGAAQSAVSTSISLLNLAYRMTQISSSSTSSSLDNKVIHPYFARTIPTNAGDARAIALYLVSLGVSNVGVLHYSDDYSIQYHLSFLQEAAARNIKVFSVQYADIVGGDESAVDQLAQSGLRYFLGIFGTDTWQSTVALAAQRRIMGVPGYSWLLSDSTSEIANPSFVLNRTTDGNNLATALNGVGVVSLYVQNYAPFDALLDQFQRNVTLQQQYINQHHDPAIFDGYVFPPTGMSLYQYLTYDAMMALGIAACEVPHDIFSGVDLDQQLLKTSFDGVSGFVSFNNITGTRQSNSFVYQIQNVVLSDNRSTAEQMQFYAPVSVLVDQRNASAPVQVLLPFIFADNTTKIPLPLPPLTVDMNLISTGARAAGLSLGGFVMVSSLAWLTWTLAQRNRDVVRASQPLFLGQLCIGTFILASSVVPMSLQEPVSQRVLDAACMSTPWLISIGFVTTFSALFSKTWRLNRLFLSGHSFRRVMVRPRDVMLPFFALMTLNIALLVLWTLLAPMHWERSPMNDVDQFGRSTASYGRCSTGGSTLAAVLTALIFLVDFSVIVFANYQAYKARSLPTDFNESFYIAVSMAFLMEIVLLGLPLTFVASQNPTTTFMIRCLLVFLSSLAIQLPVFIPKFIQRHYTYRQKIQLQRPGRSSVAMIRMAASVVSHSQFEAVASNGMDSSMHSHSERSGVPSSMGRMRVKRSHSYRPHSYTSSGSHSSTPGSPGRLSAVFPNSLSFPKPYLKRHASADAQVTMTVAIPEHLPVAPDKSESSSSQESFANGTSTSLNSPNPKSGMDLMIPLESDLGDSILGTHEQSMASDLSGSLETQSTAVDDIAVHMESEPDGSEVGTERVPVADGLHRSYAALSSATGDDLIVLANTNLGQTAERKAINISIPLEGHPRAAVNNPGDCVVEAKEAPKVTGLDASYPGLGLPAAETAFSVKTEEAEPNSFYSLQESFFI